MQALQHGPEQVTGTGGVPVAGQDERFDLFVSHPGLYPDRPLGIVAPTERPDQPGGKYAVIGVHPFRDTPQQGTCHRRVLRSQWLNTRRRSQAGNAAASRNVGKSRYA